MAVGSALFYPAASVHFMFSRIPQRVIYAGDPPQPVLNEASNANDCGIGLPAGGPWHVHRYLRCIVNVSKLSPSSSRGIEYPFGLGALWADALNPGGELH